MNKQLSILIFLSLCMMNISQAQFVSEVIEYQPAPGQFTNSGYACPSATQSLVGGVQGMLSLGAFGGFVVFKFDQAVANDPNNPYGVDFSIFGNALTNPYQNNIVTWSEHGIVSVMKDENGNGLPDDTWYELAGSDYFFSSTIKNYTATYTNPNTATDVPWSDNEGNSGLIQTNSYHLQPYYPMVDSFPEINSVAYSLSGTRLENPVDKGNSMNVTSYKKAFGYADNQVRILDFTNFNLPDNPYTEEPENTGGDAFDISWAVDENGNYVDLDEIDFVKVHTAVMADAGWLGEVSTEIKGAVDIPPNSTLSGITSAIVIKELPDTISEQNFLIEACAFIAGRYDPNAVINWNLSLNGASINSMQELSFSNSGKLVITATLGNNPEVMDIDSTFVLANGTGIAQYSQPAEQLYLYPNPATGKLWIQGIQDATIDIYNLTGKLIITQVYDPFKGIDIDDLEQGMYYLTIQKNNTYKTLKFVKEVR